MTSVEGQGPFLVTVTRECEFCDDGIVHNVGQRMEDHLDGPGFLCRECKGEPVVVSRRAFETLVGFEGSVQWFVDEQIEERGGWIEEYDDVPAEGGTVGPLPDGSTIVVEKTTWEALITASGKWPADSPPCPRRGGVRAKILAAFNASSESTAQDGGAR